MARFLKKRDKVSGEPPGSMVFVGKQKTEKIRIRLIDYKQDTINEKELFRISDERACIESDTVSWINIDGLHDVEVIREAGDVFQLHPLLLDDIVNTGQRPKFEEYDNCLFIVLKMLRYNDENEKLISEQLSMVLGSRFLLTFQEQPGDVFDPVRMRIRNKRRRIRNAGSDYLAYALMDTIVGNYINIIERMGEQIELIEDEVMGDPGKDVVERINYYKREMNYLRKTIRPARELVMHMTRSENDLIDDGTMPFLKDLLDLYTVAAESVETYRDMLSDFLNLYNTAMTNRMNDIMKVLTVFAAIFIPLTYIAGVYGTNFEYVPELSYKYSYFIFWGVTIGIALIMLFYFKRKKWL